MDEKFGEMKKYLPTGEKGMSLFKAKNGQIFCIVEEKMKRNKTKTTKILYFSLSPTQY